MGGWEKALGVAIGAVGLRKEALKRIKLGLVKIHCLALAFAPTQKSGIAMLRFYNFTCNKNKTRYTSCVMMAFFEFKKTANVYCVVLWVRQCPRQERCKAVCGEGGGGGGAL